MAWRPGRAPAREFPGLRARARHYVRPVWRSVSCAIRSGESRRQAREDDVVAADVNGGRLDEERVDAGGGGQRARGHGERLAAAEVCHEAAVKRRVVSGAAGVPRRRAPWVPRTRTST